MPRDAEVAVMRKDGRARNQKGYLNVGKVFGVDDVIDLRHPVLMRVRRGYHGNARQILILEQGTEFGILDLVKPSSPS